LRARGLLDETVLVVTSDHGENLGEHAMVDHVFSLYEPTVQIPLLIRYPAAIAGEPSRVRGVHVGAPVQLTDVYVTLANLAGVDPGPAHGFDLRTTVLPADRPILLSYDYPAQALKAMRERANDPLLDRYRRRLWALREGDVKLILDDDGSLELYDLGTDPGELVDVAGEDVERAEAKRRRLLELLTRYSRKGHADQPADDVDEDTRAMLERLGYL
jgi:arylsulfatase A-like enzyme